ncbi:MAG: Rieske 2Fe-2S domain-containing protein [Chloroflexi bacterium]|nr:Rieske 2Fe-2S domain-containing protein [Chloroflexota bacterium]MYK33662.1 Rieske 2Fe-2S domain-containing protein [Chloroflexota bacterium]
MRNDEELEMIQVGPGTPSGDVFRRYWLPVEVSQNVGGGSNRGVNNPVRVTVFGEHLILFRDSRGEPHLMGEHCSHRGTSLSYGRVEDDCIRCLYHGWLYDGDGNVVEMPGEPPGSRFNEKVTHLSYPCFEVGGLIFAYMGPPELKPLFPRYHQLFSDDGVRVTGNGGYVERCNVFQALHDNNMDPWHGEIAHGWFRDPPKVGSMYWGPDGQLATPVKFERTQWGTRMKVLKEMSKHPGQFMYHETHTVWPTQRCNQDNAGSIKWAMPVDDYNTRWFTVDFYPFEDGKISKEGQAAIDAMNSPLPSIGRAGDLPPDWAQQVGSYWNYGHPWRQGNIWEDEVAQQTQGPAERNYLPDWEQWHLGTTDEGLILNRRVWREQMVRVKEGQDPIGIIRAPEDNGIIRITSDNIAGLSREEGMRLFNMNQEERSAMVAGRPFHTSGRARLGHE